MPRDTTGIGDALEATVTTPDDEYAASEYEDGLEVVKPERRGALLPHTVENKDPRGFAAYVAWQDAPICVRDVTFAADEQTIEDNLDAYLASVTQSQCNEALGPWS